MFTFSPTLLLKPIKIKFLVIKLSKLKNELRKITSKVFKGHYWNYRRFTDESQTTTDVSKMITDGYRWLTENYRRITEESQTSHRRVKEKYRQSQMSHKRLTDNYKQVTESHRQVTDDYGPMHMGHRLL